MFPTVSLRGHDLRSIYLTIALAEAADKSIIPNVS